MIILKSEYPSHNMAKILKGTVVPRPIAWVSSVSKNGIVNLAPYSFFNALSGKPIMVGFSVSKGISGEKDTLSNVKATKNFVVNMVSAKLASAMQISSAQFPADVNEFEKAGLSQIASELVEAPRVEESPISMECELHKIYPIGSNHFVVGEVVCFHISDEVYMEGDYIDANAYDPIGRMAGDYTLVRDFFFPEI